MIIKHFPKISFFFQTSPKHPPNTPKYPQTPSKHPPNTLQTPPFLPTSKIFFQTFFASKQLPNTPQTPPKHPLKHPPNTPLNTLQTLDNPLKHPPNTPSNTLQTLDNPLQKPQYSTCFIVLNVPAVSTQKSFVPASHHLVPLSTTLPSSSQNHIQLLLHIFIPSLSPLTNPPICLRSTTTHHSPSPHNSHTLSHHLFYIIIIYYYDFYINYYSSLSFL